MIHYRPNGNMLTDELEAIVNPVNCVGVMGAGLARKVKLTWPQYFQSYLMDYRRRRLRIGSCIFFSIGSNDPTEPVYIISFPTKFHWKELSKLGFIESGLTDLVRIIKNRGIRSIGVPMLGCGLGGLDWKDVRPLIEQALGELDCDVYVYGPSGEAEETDS